MSSRNQTELGGTSVGHSIDGQFIQQHLQILANARAPHGPDSRIRQEIGNELAYGFIRVGLDFQCSLMPDYVPLLQQRL